MTGAANLLGVIIEIVGMIIKAAMSVASVIMDNWSFIEPLIGGIVTALGLYYGAMVAYNTITGIATGITAAQTFATQVHAAALAMSTGATFTATAAQYGFNAALLACPLTWIIALIIAAIALLYVVIAAINKVAGTSISATGIICGAVNWMVALVKNILIALWNFIVDIVVTLENTLGSLADFIVGVFQNPLNAVAVLFFDLADVVLGILETIASSIDTIFGSSLSSAVKGWRSSLSGWVSETFDISYKGEKITGDSLKLDRVDMTDAYSSGYEFGKGIDDKVSSLFSGEDFDISGYNFDWDGVSSDISSIADDTSDISNSVDISDENLKYLRDIAETEAINRFTTAEISVSMNNNNNISSNMDIDGVVGHLSAGVLDAMQQAAEGVH
jgi:hypothetical protein